MVHYPTLAIFNLSSTEPPSVAIDAVVTKDGEFFDRWERYGAITNFPSSLQPKKVGL
jgi:hypothetical protein